MGDHAALIGRRPRGEVPIRVVIETRDGAVHEAELARFIGQPGRPPGATVEEKFHALVSDRYGAEWWTKMLDTVRGLEAETVAELPRLLD